MPSPRKANTAPATAASLAIRNRQRDARDVARLRERGYTVENPGCICDGTGISTRCTYPHNTELSDR